MSKAIKGSARRKPPEPAQTHADIDEWFGRLMPGLQPIVREVDRSIRATVPGLHYALEYKRAFYGLPEFGWIIEIAPYDVSVNVVFFGGADFDPAPPLGTAGRARYLKVTTVAQARGPQPRGLISQAGRTQGWT